MAQKTRVISPSIAANSLRLHAKLECGSGGCKGGFRFGACRLPHSENFRRFHWRSPGVLRMFRRGRFSTCLPRRECISMEVERRAEALESTIEPGHGGKPHAAAAPAGGFIARSDDPCYWGNEDGDRIAARQAFAQARQNPELFIAAATVLDWRSANGWLNGAYITEALDLMPARAAIETEPRHGGVRQHIDWTDAAKLRQAIREAPVELGIDADQFENLWFAHHPNLFGPSDDWPLTGFIRSAAAHRPVSLCGFGSIAWLAEQLGAGLPGGVDGSQPGHALFTWRTVGIIDAPSLRNITRAAYHSHRGHGALR